VLQTEEEIQEASREKPCCAAKIVQLQELQCQQQFSRDQGKICTTRQNNDKVQNLIVLPSSW
jgi:hypothetical protein